MRGVCIARERGVGWMFFMSVLLTVFVGAVASVAEMPRAMAKIYGDLCRGHAALVLYILCLRYDRLPLNIV